MDIGISWNPRALRGDWTVTSGDLVVDPGGLRSAVLLSLFTDGLAPPDYVPPAGSAPGRRGYWGDSFEALSVGSLLWTLDRSKKSGDLALLNAARDICNTALQWLIDDGVVDTVTVQTIWQQPDVIGIQVTLTKPLSPPNIFNFGWSWLGA